MDNYIVSRDVKAWDEIVPMMNKIFKKNFFTLLPKIYTEPKYMRDHFVVRDGGKVVANVASVPNTLYFGENSLNVRGIGMVSVKKSHRKRGIMDSILREVMDTAREEQVDFMYLSGNRKRYERYGFVPCETCVSYQLIKENVEHSKVECDLEFVKIDQKSGYLPRIIQLYQAQAVRYERENFYKVISSWNAKNFYAILKDGEVVGHIVTRYMSIVDFNIVGVSAKDMAINYFRKAHKLPFLNITAYPNRLDILDSLASVCQKYSLTTNCMANIVDYKRVITKVLSAQTPSVDYDFILEIENSCKLRIVAKDGVFDIADTANEPNIVLPKDSATSILLSPHLSLLHGIPFFLNVYVTEQDNC